MGTTEFLFEKSFQPRRNPIVRENRLISTDIRFSSTASKQKLDGRVLYWFLAGELVNGFERGHTDFALVHERWEEFKETNPYSEYNEAIEAALTKALVLQSGQPAPDFTLDDLDGQPVSLNQFKGKAIFIDFWASWCGPCIVDLPYIQKIKAEMAEQPVVFLNNRGEHQSSGRLIARLAGGQKEGSGLLPAYFCS